MSTKYCDYCKRTVEARRNIGTGTLILALLTGGGWLLVIPLYSKRCPICKSDALSAPPSNPGNGSPGSAIRHSTTGVLVLVGLAIITILSLPEKLITSPSKTHSNASPNEPAQVTPQVAPLAGNCSQQPLDIFPVGETLESDQLAKLIDANCPNAKYYPNEWFEVAYQDHPYYVQTKKIDDSVSAKYRIQAISSQWPDDVAKLASTNRSGSNPRPEENDVRNLHVNAVDCIDLSLALKERGIGWMERVERVQNAERTGGCYRTK